jgi:hypothetical protein
MAKIKTVHIDEYPQEQLKSLCKQYYVRARKAEKERDEAVSRIRALQSELNEIRGSVYDIVNVFEGGSIY